jgi:predicted nuclease of predicted toxin-antitoxin system
MAHLYADEGFPAKVTALLVDLGHNVLTAQSAGQANQRIPDDQVLAFATSQNRAVLTINRGDFIRLHRSTDHHAGMIVCTENVNRQQLAQAIHNAILGLPSLEGQLIRVNRPATT